MAEQSNPEPQRTEITFVDARAYGLGLLGLASRLKDGRSPHAILFAQVNQVVTQSASDTLRDGAYYDFKLPFTLIDSKLEAPV